MHSLHEPIFSSIFRLPLQAKQRPRDHQVRWEREDDADLELRLLDESAQLVDVRVGGRRVDDARQHVLAHVLRVAADRRQRRRAQRHLDHLSRGAEQRQTLLAPAGKVNVPFRNTPLSFSLESKDKYVTPILGDGVPVT